jgi:hypothetical protein
LFISGDSVNCSFNVYNSVFSRGGGGGSDHIIYMGNCDHLSPLNIKNSILSQAAGQGHDLKSRSVNTTVTNSKILLNIDPIYFGSEVWDASNGRICNASNSLFVNGNMGNDHYSDDQSFDVLRFAADDSAEPTLTSNYLNAQNNVWVSDGGTVRQFILQFRPMTPSPPYSQAGNTFVFRNTAQYNNGTSSGAVFQQQNAGGLAIATSTQAHAPPTVDTFNVGLGTLGTTNFVFPDRASAGLPLLTGTAVYPQLLGYSSPAFNIPLGGTEWIGLVKVPPS